VSWGRAGPRRPAPVGAARPQPAASPAGHAWARDAGGEDARLFLCLFLLVLVLLLVAFVYQIVTLPPHLAVLAPPPVPPPELEPVRAENLVHVMRPGDIR
jgi:hypothetical protein